MASFNRTVLLGNLTKDPELRYTNEGVAVSSFDLAVNEKRTDRKTGEKKEDVLFIRVTCWARLAESCAEYLGKGSLALVEGRLRMNQWEAKDGGGKRSRIELVAQNVQFLTPSKGKGKGQLGNSDIPSDTNRDAPLAETGDAVEPGPVDDSEQ